MKSNKLNKLNKPFSRKLLKAIVIGGAVIIAASNPLFGMRIFDALKKELERKKWKRFRDDLYYLKRRGFIEVEQNPDGTYTVQPTIKGKHHSQKYNLDDISIPIPKKWDKCWRLAVFDIPARKQKGRLALLSKLKEFGFIMLQKSIWAYPFECQNEVAVLARAFEVDMYIQYLTCSRVSAGEYLREEFEKRNAVNLI